MARGMISEGGKSIAVAMVFYIAVLAALFIPFRVIGYGYLPQDDALRHSAKVISGKAWDQIVVMRPEIKMDSQYGWDAVLTAVHKATGWDAHSLVLFSVISLFILFFLTPIFFTRYPEAWLASLAVISIAIPGWFGRLLLGRPYIVSMSALLVILFLWPKLKDKRPDFKVLSVITVVIALSMWMHGTCYVYALVIAGLLIARQRRASAMLAACAVLGVFIGAALTGHPVIFLKQSFMRLVFVFGSSDTDRLLAMEVTSFYPDFKMAVVALGFLGWRALRGAPAKRVADDPVFILVIISFVLGILSRRAWVDVGIPAMAVWMTGQFEGPAASYFAGRHWSRAAITAALSVFLFISITTDIGGRWSLQRPNDYLSANNPVQAAWLPEPGGIIYSDSMNVFFETFFKNPRADWRYILGFESAFMPEEDLKTFRNIQKNPRTYLFFDPWVKKMRPQDRLVIKGNSESKPKIPQLDWNYAASGTWVGRLPKSSQK